MTSKIEQFLNKILSSRYGKDVRQAIHDGIKQCYDDVTNPDLNTEAFETAVQNKIDSGELALMTIPDGSITKEKLDQDTNETIEKNTNDITDLKSNLNNFKATVNEKTDEIFKEISEKLPILYLYGDTSGMTHDDRVNLRYKYVDSKAKILRTGWCDCKWQGDSSLAFDEKNYTIRFYHDANCERKDKISYLDDVKESKWVTKANWIDPSHARNIINARLWGDVVKSRHTEVPQELSDSPRYGSIDGRPIVIWINGTYHGLYTLNIPKDDFTFGMDEDNPLHCAVGGNYQGGTCEFRTTGIDSWGVEVPDEFPVGVKEKLTQLCSFVESSEDETFYSDLNNYLDVESAIDYYICAYFLGWTDSLVKNVMLLTYDGGQKWYCHAYDLDCVLGNKNNTNDFFSPTIRCPEDYYGKNSALWPRMEKLFGTEIYNRYKELRDTVLSIDYITQTIDNFVDLIPSEEYEKDRVKWTGKPNRDIDHREQMISWITERAVYVDGEMADLIPPIEATSIELNVSSYEFSANEPFTLYATIEPQNSTETVTWESSNPEVATVDSNGTVTPIYSGSCTITAKTNKTGLVAECEISILDGLYDGNVKFAKLTVENYSFNGTTQVYWTGYAFNEEYCEILLGYDVLKIKNTNCRVVFYDQEFKPISGFGNNWQSLCVTIPTNAKYFRVAALMKDYPSRLVPVEFYNQSDYILSTSWPDQADGDINLTTGEVQSGSFYVSTNISIPEDANAVYIADLSTRHFAECKMVTYNEEGTVVNSNSIWWNNNDHITAQNAKSVRFAVRPNGSYTPEELYIYYR